MTARYGVIGNPIAHSRSPLIHRAFAEQTGIDLDYTAILAPLDGFAATVENFRSEGGLGLNVTVPFKAEAFALCATLSERAQRAGAVNTLIFPADTMSSDIQGDNTDGVGLLRDLAFHQIQLKGKKILLLGAGGASRGVLAPLLAEIPARLLIANRRVATAEELATDFQDVSGERTQLGGCALEALPAEPFDLIINATSASLSGEQLALPDALIGPNTTAYDMAYGREPTVFMHWGAALGAFALDGLGMLVEQAAESFYLWHGIRPQTNHVRDLLKASLDPA
ncbi:MAG: shikimate dehydrogenase [Halothiobacillus sp. 13-55-253]|jgi:shikimate dehydrogenase|nr:MAG: shikimate dehydrogenase [Halothiobacillus sp. 13-55-253]